MLSQMLHRVNSGALIEPLDVVMGKLISTALTTENTDAAEAAGFPCIFNFSAASAMPFAEIRSSLFPGIFRRKLARYGH
jgi:hypothetical protein